MQEQEQEKKPVGRPPQDEYKGITRKAVTTQWPETILQYIDQVTNNRTKWLIEAAREKMEREQNEFSADSETHSQTP